MATAEASKYCISCGFALAKSARFCSSCGTQQQIQSAPNAYVRLGENNNEEVNNNNNMSVAVPPSNSNSSNPQSTVVYVMQPMGVSLPAGVQYCSYQQCGTVTTVICTDCHKWTCAAHLITMRGYTRFSAPVVVCPECKHKRSNNKCLLLCLTLCILIVLMGVFGAVNGPDADTDSDY